MYIVAACGHKADIRTDISKVDGDLIKVTKDWQSAPCPSCQWISWLQIARKLVPDEADLPKLKGRGKSQASEIRREYLAIICGILYDGELPDLEKVRIYNARVLQQTNAEWWVDNRILPNRIKDAAPSAKTIPLIKQFVATLLVDELEAIG